ncbi:MAG: hypothetical protein ABUL49_01455, partial [bacterium]
MDELEVLYMTYLQEKYRPLMDSGQMTGAQYKLQLESAQRVLPVLRENRERNGSTGSLTESEVTAASLEESSRSMEKSVGLMKRKLEGELDPVRRKLVETLLTGANNRIAEARRLAADPESINEDDLSRLASDAFKTPQEMNRVVREAAHERIIALVERGFATFDDPLFKQYEELKTALDDMTAVAKNPGADHYKPIIHYRTLSNEFYASLKERERLAEVGDTNG